VTGKRRSRTPLSDDVPAQSRSGRNPIRKIGEPMGNGHVRLPNDVVRQCGSTIGLDGLGVLAYLMTHEQGWETSAAEIAESLGWGGNRKRVAAAIKALVAHRRMILREHYRESGGHKFTEYVLRLDGGQVTEDEIEKWSVATEHAGGRGSRRKRRAD
jgi:hypothetical protein